MLGLEEDNITSETKNYLKKMLRIALKTLVYPQKSPQSAKEEILDKSKGTVDCIITLLLEPVLEKVET